MQMARFSTGLRNALATSYGLAAMMNAGVIRVYGGTLPVSPDYPPDSVELGRITSEGKVFIPGNQTTGAGLLLGHLSPGSLVNNGEWRLRGLASGAATWWRWHWAGADDLGPNTLVPRVDGRVGGELVLADPQITPDTNRTIEQFLMVIGMGN
jgi:hypothetical protein